MQTKTNKAPSSTLRLTLRPLPGAEHDDAPDATEGAIRLLQGLR
jgi:hypothetical protein